MSGNYKDISIESLAEWSKAIESDKQTQLGAAALRSFNADEALIDRSVYLKNTTNVFNNSVKTEGLPRTNQRSTGRCWLFAATNVLRLGIMKKYNLKEFQFSQSYLFFYDKLEKANYFLDQFHENIQKEDIESRLMQHLLTDPVNDGGQFDMFINIIEKYGLVPNDLYTDANSATASRTMNFMITSKLREFAEILKDAYANGKDIKSLKKSMQHEIYRLLTIFLGEPPLPEDKLVWEYKDKDDKIGVIEFTPLQMYKEHVGIDLTNSISLLNDPRNKYGYNIRIDKLGNAVNGRTVKYLNLEIDEVARYAIKSIQNDNAVFFGTHSPIYMDRKLGIMDQKLYNYKLIDFELNQGKASRIQYKQSLMTHAMVLTAVHLDSSGNPVRWKVENSYGEDSGQKGYFVMDHQYFKDYVYQIVVSKGEMDKKHQDIVGDESKTITLPVWDAMGALAAFKNPYNPLDN